MELSRKLRQRGHESADIDEVLQRLAEQGLQSEQRFAEHYVAERRAKGHGPLRIRAELQERGIDDRLCDIYLNIEESDWREQLLSVHNKKFGGAPPKDRADMARRARFLQYRGFTAAQVSRILNLDDF